MKQDYEIITTNDFDRSFKKFTKKNRNLAQKIISTLEKISEDPFYKGLKTHKVQSKNYGIAFTSRITGDIRIIWDFAQNKPIIIALTIGKHSGKWSVYK